MIKIDVKLNDFKITIIAEMREQIKQEVLEALQKEIKKRWDVESTVGILQEHVKNHHKQVNELNTSQEELKQYGKRLCIRIDGVPVTENEISSDVLENFKRLTEEFSSEIPDVAIDMANLIGKTCTDETFGVKCKSIIIWFTAFRHRTMFY